MTPMKLISAGVGLAGVAVVVGVAIWQSHPKDGFFQLSGWVTIAAFALGAFMTAVGLWTREGTEGGTNMTQTAGDHSTQYQAGGDLHIGDRKRQQ